MAADDFLSQLMVLNKNLTVNQKLSIATLGTVVLFGIMGFVYLMNQESLQILIANLEPSDTQSVVQKLEQAGIPFELGDGGRAVMVSPEDLDKARLEVSSEGLASRGRIGFELFDQSNWTVTDFAEKINYRRALEGELQRTIVLFSDVASVRVHIVMQENTLFAENQEPAKASVWVKTEAGSLSKRTVTGIRNLVAGAVPGLSDKQVTLVDEEGNPLSNVGGSDDLLDSSQLEAKRKVEKDLEQKVISILENVVGPGKVRATASVLLDYQETEETQVIYDPDAAVVSSQQTSRERTPVSVTVQPSGPADGAAGAAQPQQSTQEGSRQSDSVDYLVSGTERRTVTPRGEVRSQSVAVVVDYQVQTSTDEAGETTRETVPRDVAEMEKFQSLVASAIGFDAERGDQIEVQQFPFSRTQEVQDLYEPSFLDQYKGLVLMGARYLAILVLFFAFYRFIFKPVKEKMLVFTEFEEPEFAQLAASTGNPEMVKQLQEQMRLMKEGAGTLALPAVSKEEEEKKKVKRQLVDLAEADPQVVTNLIRNWLSE